jgi:plastocyanin
MSFGLLLGIACGDDDDSVPATASSAPATNTPAPAEVSATSIEVRAVDYAFEGVPEKVAAGTTFTLVNESTEEVHEIVAIRIISDSETRSVEELVQLPDEELEGIVAEMPAMVIVAPPGEEGMVVLGDGTLSEPGRYGLLCFIPTGADPEAVMEAEGEFPEEVGGPPHAFQGMFAEVIVE